MQTTEISQKQILFWLRLIGIAVCGILIATLITMASVLGAVQQTEAALTSLQESTENLQVVSAQLAQIDWVEMSQALLTTAEVAQQSLQSASVAIDALDIAGLNNAIANLNKAIEPFSNFAGLFNR